MEPVTQDGRPLAAEPDQSRVAGIVAKLLLDPQQLVVLSHPLGAGRWFLLGRTMGATEIDQLTALCAGALYASPAAGAQGRAS